MIGKFLLWVKVLLKLKRPDGPYQEHYKDGEPGFRQHWHSEGHTLADFGDGIWIAGVVRTVRAVALVLSSIVRDSGAEVGKIDPAERIAGLTALVFEATGSGTSDRRFGSDRNESDRRYDTCIHCKFAQRHGVTSDRKAGSPRELAIIVPGFQIA